MMRRAAARLRDGQGGLTLVELLVVMGLLTVVGAIAMSGLVRGMQTATYSQQRGDAVQATQIALERVSRELRAADPLRAAAPGAVTVDVYRQGALLQYEFRVEAAGTTFELVQELRRFDDPTADPTSDTPDAVTESVLVSDLVDEDVFVLLDASGTAGASAADTRQVQIVLERAVDGEVDPIEVTTTVKVRNA